MKREEFGEVVLREKEKSFFISRIPKRVKEEIIEFANQEFCEDYGAAVHYIWDNFKIWKVFFENIDMKLDVILSRLESKKEETDKEINLLSGKKINLKGGKDAKTK